MGDDKDTEYNNIYRIGSETHTPEVELRSLHFEPVPSLQDFLLRLEYLLSGSGHLPDRYHRW